MSLTLKDLTLRFNEIPAKGQSFQFSQSSGPFNTVLADILGDYPIYNIDLNIRPVEETVQLNGKLSGELRHLCSRCAEEFTLLFNKSFTTAYYKSEDNIKNFSDAFNDIEGSFDLEFLNGNEINLAEAVHEQIALEIPFQPLCSEGCKGLCQKCCVNLNFSKCSCPQSETPIIEKPSPFEQLKVLKGD